MIRKISIVFVAALLIVFTSCVSKKKYLEMQSGRLKAEEMSRKLSAENDAKAERIKALIADFENMKNELLESNAIKDNYIDSLNSRIFILKEDLNKREESLEKTSFNLDFEKQRLTNALESKDKTIKSLQANIDKLETEVSNVKTVVDQKNYEISNLKDQITVLERKIESGNDELTGLQKKLDKVKAETGDLKKQLNDKDATIKRLENNVKLLKKEIGNK